MFVFYKSQYNPEGLSGTVGGQISTTPLSGYIGEVLANVEAPPEETSVSSNQYRKIFVKNEYATSSEHTRLWLDAVEHPAQIYLAVDATTGGTISSPLTAPSGVSVWSAPSNYAEGIDLGTISRNGYKAIWIKQMLSGITEPDPYATFRLYVGGIVE